MLKAKIEKLSSKSIFWLLSGSVVLTYLNGLFNGFVWDDEEQILNNALVHHLSNWWRLFLGSTFNTGGGGLSGWYYKPLMSLSFMLNWFIWGRISFGYHLFQLGLHLVNVYLVFLIVEKILTCQKIQPTRTIAFFTALIWGVHPGISETVFYISATQGVLFTLFSLLAFLVVLKKEVRSRDWLVFGSLSLLALLSKEAAVSAIILIGGYLFFYRRSLIWQWLMTMSLVFGGYFFLRLGIAKVGFGSSRIIPIVKASLNQRLITLPYIVFSYFRLVFWPKKLCIAQHFVLTTLSDYRFLESVVVLSVIFGVAVYIYLVRIKKKDWLFWWFWLGVGLGPLVNIFPLDMSLAERWLYFPAVGLIVVFLIFWFKISWKYREWVLVGLVLLLMVRTGQRSFDWRNGYRLYSHDILLNPTAFDLNNNYGVELYRHGQVEKAAKYFQRSVELAPDWWTNHSNLGVVLAQKGNLTAAEKEYRLAIKNGNYYLAYENLIELLIKKKEYSQAIKVGEKGLKNLPLNFKLNYYTTLAYLKEGNKEKSLYFLNRLVKLYPQSPLVQNLMEQLNSSTPKF